MISGPDDYSNSISSSSQKVNFDKRYNNCNSLNLLFYGFSTTLISLTCLKNRQMKFPTFVLSFAASIFGSFKVGDCTARYFGKSSKWRERVKQEKNSQSYGRIDTDQLW